VTASYFDFQDFWWFYAGFTCLVLFLLALDLGVFHRKAHAVSFKEASTWTVVWVTLALLFNYLLYKFCLYEFTSNPAFSSLPNFDAALEAKRLSLEFLTGYLIEQSLSVDNIFIFVVVFNYFAVPAQLQHRVLFFGVLGALIFRALFITLGSFLMKFHIVIYFFGALLIFTGIKMAISQEKELQPEKNLVIRALRKFFPITSEIHGQRFSVMKDGKRYFTPLFVALIFLEVTDLIFAIDSVPAIFAITSEPLIVFTSNIFAILGLRSLYFLLSGAMNRFHLLKYGLAVVLVFVGLKMVYLDQAFGGKFPIVWSLAIILGVLSLSIAASFALPSRKDRN